MLSTEILDAIRSGLVSKFSPEKIFLFGSQARGDADNKSDIDLVVITEIKEDRLTMMNKMRLVLSSVNYPVDVIVLTESEFERDKKYPGTVARYVSREGILLYGS